MLRLTLAQMRRSLGRLAAAGIAIAIGAAFVAATLLASAVMTRTSLDAVAASYADADLVVTHPAGLPHQAVDALREVDGVGAADGRLSLYVELSHGSRRVVHQVTATATDPRLDAQRVVDGRAPAAGGEVALPGALAERLDVRIGDTVTAHRGTWLSSDPAVDAGGGADGAGGGDGGPSADADGGVVALEPRWVEQPEQLTVVGLVDDPTGAFAQSGGAAVLTGGDVARWAAADSLDGEPRYDSAVVVLAAGTGAEAAGAALAAALPEGSTVRTKDEQARAMTAELTDGADIFTAIVLGFAAVALLVAALVISNTFGVLVAQRTRTLALLRCVGADRRQLRRSVLLEAALLGGVASLVGLAVGVGVGQGALWVLGRTDLDVPLPTTVTLTPAVIGVPLLVGTVVTLLASLAPARAATRVAPLAALRPADAPTVTGRRDLPRRVLAVVGTVGGLLLLGAAVALASVDPLVALAVGVLGGALSFVGVLVGAVFWLPRVVGVAGRALRHTGTSARLAAANTVRNPRRTAATSTALLIGVTLVTMMSTGAASARVTLANELDAQFPVDVRISGAGAGAADPSADGDAGTDPVTPTLVGAVRAVEGVRRVATVREASVTVTSPDGAEVPLTALALDPADGVAVLRLPAMIEGLTDDTVVLAQDTAAALGVSTGDGVTLNGAGVGAATSASGGTDATVERTVVVTALPDGALLTPATLAMLSVPDTGVVAWARLADDADPGRVVAAVQDALVDTPVQVTGAAVERAMFEGVIDTLLAVVLGLLAVAVVIAVIGVANTLSLSVLERRRESATLRVLGLSRNQLRATLAVEGMLIAGVAAVLGVLLGVLYGWAGAATVLRPVGDVRLDVPWGDLGLVLAAALAAGLLASVLPGRSAARTSPVAALAVD